MASADRIWLRRRCLATSSFPFSFPLQTRLQRRPSTLSGRFWIFSDPDCQIGADACARTCALVTVALPMAACAGPASSHLLLQLGNI